MTMWRTVVERRPHGRARMALATALMDAGQHTQAIAQLRQAVPDFPDARAALGAELLQQNKDEGVSILRRFIADDPRQPNRIPAHLLLADAFGAQGQIDEAAVEWRAILALAPGNDQARMGLARILSAQAQSALRQNDPARGETAAREAVQLAPGDAAAHNLLGIALASTGRIDQATVEFREAAKLAPDDAQVRRNLERATRAHPSNP